MTNAGFRGSATLCTNTRGVNGMAWCKRCLPESLGLLECLIIEYNIINCARLSLLVVLMLGLTQREWQI